MGNSQETGLQSNSSRPSSSKWARSSTAPRRRQRRRPWTSRGCWMRCQVTSASRSWVPPNPLWSRIIRQRGQNAPLRDRHKGRKILSRSSRTMASRRVWRIWWRTRTWWRGTRSTWTGACSLPATHSLSASTNSSRAPKSLRRKRHSMIEWRRIGRDERKC